MDNQFHQTAEGISAGAGSTFGKQFVNKAKRPTARALDFFCNSLMFRAGPYTTVAVLMPTSRKRFLTMAALFGASIACRLGSPPLSAQQAPSGGELANIARSFVVNGRTIDTKSYLDQAWEAKGRPGLFYSGGMNWDPQTRQWHVKPVLPPDFSKTVAYYASFTLTVGQLAVNIAKTYHEASLADELAKFYSTFLHANFTTLGELRRTNAPQIKQKLLGPELGPDSTRTLAWWADSDGGVILRECFLCNEEYFIPVAGLIEVIAKLKTAERTPAMTQFVGEYVPILVSEHILRANFAELMRAQMNPSSGNLKRRNMSEEEIGVVIAAAVVLGADAADPKLVALTSDDRAKLRDLVKVGADRFQFSRTLTKDSEGRTCALYFKGDYDYLEDFDYAGYQGEKFPTPADKAKVKGTSWDIGHFYIAPTFLRALYDHRTATGVDFPRKEDIEHIGNQYAYHVFEGDYKKPLFKNFFDGTDGWYRVGYLGRTGYGIAPSHYCSQSDRSHSCNTIGAISSWGLLASFHPGIARIGTTLLDLARSKDPTVACFQAQCFRERYYRYADFSFSFLDEQGNIQYPPALIVILSELAVSSSTEPAGSLSYSP
jgi:hypothetical protein